MVSQFQQILELNGDKRDAKLKKLLTSCIPGNRVPLYRVYFTRGG